MPKVLVFRELLLPISETFILAQTGALETYEAKFAGIRRTSPSLDVPGDPLLLVPQTDGRVSRLLTKVYKCTKFAPSFHQAAAEFRPDLVHAHFAPDGVAAAILAERLGVPLAVTLHGYDVTVRTDFKARYGELWRKADRFICISEFIRKKAIAAGFPAEKLCVHYIGVDRDKFHPSGEDRTEGLVLFVGRLVEKKGCTHLLRAMHEVQLKHPRAHLVVIGNGPLRSSLEQQAASLGLNCKFLGGQDQTVIRGFLERASVFCAPSVTATNGDSEGLGIVFLEAQAMGLPIVSSCHGGIPEAVHDGETGLLAGEGDHHAIADHILRFLTDEPFRRSCASRGRDWVATRFDLKKQTKLLEDIYTDATNARCRN